MATKKVNIDIVAKDKSQAALNSVRGSLNKLKSSVFNVRNALAGLGGGLVVRNLVNTGKELENLQVRLKFLLKDTNEGAKAFDNMVKFASKVPFSLEEIQAGSGILATVTDNAEDLQNMLEITGNVAAVTGLDFRTASEQIQRSFSAGIGAADLFREKGVRNMLGFKAGATVSIEETVEAFEKVFGSGGRFGQATDELADTFEGTLSMIGDKFFSFKKTILEAGFFPELKKQFGDFDKFLEENSKTLDEIAVIIGTSLAIAVKKLAEGMKFLVEHFDKFVLAIKVIIALKVAKVFMGIATATLNIAKATMALAASTSAVKKGFLGLVGIFATGGIAYIALQQIDEMFEDFLDTVNEAASGKGFNSLGAQMNSMGIIANKTKKEIEELNEVYKSGLGSDIESLVRANMTEEQLVVAKYNDQLELLKHYQNNVKNLTELDRKILANLEIKLAKNLSKDLEEIRKKDILAKAKERSEELRLMQEHYNKQLQIIKTGKFSELELEKLTKDQIKDLTRATGRELIGELAKHNRQMFMINKALAIRDAIMNTAQGITKALALGPFGIPLAGLIGGLGAVQIATIARQQYQGRRMGGNVSKDKPFIVGEAGPELFVPKQQGSIVPNHKMGGQTVNVNFTINAVDTRGFRSLLSNERGTIVNIINQAVTDKGRPVLV